MKKINLLLLALIVFVSGCEAGEKDELIVIETSHGTITLVLYDQTPKHKENFLKLAKTGDYDSTIFHRVIKGFMIQGGDAGKRDGSKVFDYTVPAEFVDTLFHKKGALCAARMGDNVNPQKASSGDEFYIVQGKVYSSDEVDVMEAQQDKVLQAMVGQLIQLPQYAELKAKIIFLESNRKYDSLMKVVIATKPLIVEEFGPQEFYKMSEKRKVLYSTVGGTPHLDFAYTVFGEVLDGIEVIDKIASQQTMSGDKPTIDVFMKVSVVEMSRAKVTKKYGFRYLN